MKRLRKIWFALLRGTRGAEIAETAMILPLLFMIVMAIFWMGQAYRIYGSLAHAARAGARAAVAPICTTCTSAVTSPGQVAQAAVRNALNAASVNPNNLVPTSQWTPPALCLCRSGGAACTTATSVPCDGTVTLNICVQENVQLTYPTGQGGMYTCGTSVSMRYQYPYSFTIPLTTLNLGNLKLPGQAQMRAETQ